MGKKPLDISGLQDRSCPPKKNPAGKAFFIAGTALVFAIIVFFSVFPPKIAAGEEKLEIFPEGPQNVLEGDELGLFLITSCGPFKTYLDGVEEGSYQQSVKTSLSLEPGRHMFEARNANCFASISLSVEKRECEDGFEQGCAAGNCNGTKTCRGGRWGNCVLQKKVCSPGQRRGCSIDSCNFGYSYCNECGSGFGPCKAENGNSTDCGEENCG